MMKIKKKTNDGNDDVGEDDNDENNDPDVRLWGWGGRGTFKFPTYVLQLSFITENVTVFLSPVSFIKKLYAMSCPCRCSCESQAHMCSYIHSHCTEIALQQAHIPGTKTHCTSSTDRRCNIVVTTRWGRLTKGRCWWRTRGCHLNRRRNNREFSKKCRLVCGDLS